jgi:EpsI family protein
MQLLTTSIVMAALMVTASIAGFVARPQAKVTQQSGPQFQLESSVPRQFAGWRELADTSARVVDPGTQALLDKLYSQMLSRTYVNEAGYKVMLSLAYGDDQRGGLAAHKPEVCYPAQGFTLLGITEAEVATPFGEIPAKRLTTSMGARKEPVTYWFAVGNAAVRNKVEQRLVEIKLGLTGQVPDGILFRVSSIDENTQRAYAAQDQFVADLLAAVSPESRKRFSGLGEEIKAR